MMVRSSAGLVPHALPRRALKAREVRVTVAAVGVNPVDWKLGDNPALRLVHKIVGPPGPFVCGIDFSGFVSEVGPRADGVAIGDAVVGAVDFRLRQRGSYASEVVVRDEQVAVLPAQVDLAAAACLPIAGVTAQMALFTHGRLPAGGKVLVLGASGGVGLMALQLARNHGATVFGVCSSRNAALVSRLGATALTYDEGDVLEKAGAHGPFDVVVNGVDAASYSVRSVARLLSSHGYQILLTPRPVDFPCLALPRVKTFSAFPTRHTLEPLVRALADGKLEVLIAERFPLQEAEQAQQYSRTGKVVGKLVLLNAQPKASFSVSSTVQA